NRNAVGFDLQKAYIDLCKQSIVQARLLREAKQIAVQDDARFVPKYFEPETISLI
ncbi:unnamed protein product, partial [marine sediment metagenome]